jgi:hypothetical protein
MNSDGAVDFGLDPHLLAQRCKVPCLSTPLCYCKGKTAEGSVVPGVGKHKGRMKPSWRLKSAQSCLLMRFSLFRKAFSAGGDVNMRTKSIIP